MRKRRVVLTPDANADLDQIGEYVSSIYREEAGIRFVKRMFLDIVPLGISADFDGVDGGPRKYGLSVRPVRSAR